ncbi:nibrin [Paragonimus westermani]|uniref:Nibrin n=1 Tax=Paragonimus westermani TaxID=34504 RepID=A0A5J4NV79_9TREM|nr:nibrin [Paragonimus westermani]
MDRVTKQRMRRILTLLQGQIVESCAESCVALVMVHLVVTAKVICALLGRVPIVTPAFMEAFLEAASHVPFVRPDPNSYLPPLREPRLVAGDAVRFLPNEVRRSLFQSKSFYALTNEQFTQLESIIRLGQGELFLIDSKANFSQHYRKRFTEDQLDLESRLRRVFKQKGACVLHTQRVSSHDKEWQRVVYSALRAIRRRPILESELGFAVVYASTSGYCNPETKCPEKLYEEAGISEAFSVNPFHMGSQSDRPVLEDLPSNAPELSGSRPFLKRAWNPTDFDVTSTVGFTKRPRKASPKRTHQVTDIVPPREMDFVPKSNCLAADSDPLMKSPSPSVRSPPSGRFTDASKSPKPVQLFIHSMPPNTSMQMSGNNEDPGSPCLTSKVSGTLAG